MIGISKLYCGTVEASDPLRYGRKSEKLPSHLLQFSKDKKPVIVWNITSKCNLRCLHCYASAKPNEKEMSTSQGISLITELKDYGVPVILFSGGEPTLREDLPTLVDAAVKARIRAVISSNGTLITKDMAMRLSDLGLSYVGISLDGMEKVNDSFRGVTGAFKGAMQGIYNAMMADIKVGLRFTINKQNYKEIANIFDLMTTEGIKRACFYHLVYTGRAKELMDEDLSHDQTRQTVDLIIDRTSSMIEKGVDAEVLTVDNHADGPYIYLRMKKEKNSRAENVLKLLKMNQGNSTGLGIGCVSWDGTVYPDQFWRNHPLGNILERPFSKIWDDPENDFLMKLKNKKEYVKGRCQRCRWLDVCAGNFRARAEAATDDPWGEDPACYLSDEEIDKGGSSK